MRKFYIFLEGSNDLFYPLNKSLCLLLWNIYKINNVDLDIIYSLENIDDKSIWKGGNDEFYINNSSGVITINNNGFKYSKNDDYIKTESYDGKNINIMDINKYLIKNMNNNNENIVIISGHGGPFQCLLNMNQEYPASMNTRKLCDSLSDLNIDLLYLDMCAMNYIDTIYELICKNNIKNIVTYKGLAPYDSQDYIEIIRGINSNDTLDNNISRYFYLSKLPLIYLNKESGVFLEQCKVIFNKLAETCFNEKNADFDSEIDILKALLIEGVYENSVSRNIKGLPLNFFKYYLGDEIDRCIFNKYKFENDNLYKYLISKNEKKEEPNIVFLSEDSLEHIIGLHNPTFDKNKLKNIMKDFLVKCR